MKKILTILLLVASLNSNAQTLSTDSLSTIIRTLQRQVAYLMLNRTIYFDSTQMIVSDNPDSLNRKVTIRPWITQSGILAQKDSVNISLLTTQLNALQTKVYGLKATTTIQ